MVNIVKRQENTKSSWDPIGVMKEMMQNMTRWDPFRDLSSFPSIDTSTFTPSIDVSETKDNYLVKADLPGIQQKDLSISLSGNRITLTGKRESQEKHDEEHHYVLERTYGSFSRSFTLPTDVDTDKIHAELKEGVLTINIPKKSETKRKEIELKVH